LGGRLDATNVIARPEMTVITPVSMDHEQYLGNSIASIAFEKAGIIKASVPCVVSRQEPEGMEVIEEVAGRLGAPLLAYGQQWHAGPDRDRISFQDDSGLLDLPMPNLPGAHQIMNAGAALAVLRHLGIGAEACEAAVTRAEWPARMQRLRKGPLVEAAPGVELWLDGGHNPAAGEAMAAHLGSLSKRPTYLICGMLNTKDIGGYLRPLAPVVDGLCAVSIPGEANTLPAEATASAARQAGMAVSEAESVEAALRSIARSTPQARVLICGSLYLAGSVLRENG
jgi:dihydrofolate synthase/folylpolyglutamate synthase